MKTIWKYEARGGGDRFSLEMPKGARALSAGIQGQDIVIWAAVDPDEPAVRHDFAVHGTGHNVPDENAAASFLTTIFMGPLVFHVFDLGEVSH